MLETSRCHHYLLSYLPIYAIFNCKLRSSNSNVSRDCAPSGYSWFSIHREFTVEATDTFVSEHGLLSIVVVSMHDKGQLVSVRMLFGSSYKSTSI